jgi:polysaccharide export outer membrane protein
MMRRQLASSLACVLLLGASAAAPPAEPAPTPPSVEVVIGLPSAPAPVEIAADEQRIALDLPQDAELPEDARAASAGLLRGLHRALPANGRLLVELELADALLERTRYEPGRLVLRLKARAFRPEEFGQDQPYKLGPDDKIAISVLGQPDLSVKLTVLSDGHINAPLVGYVPAAGLSPRQLAAKVGALLDRYLVNPQVDVEVEEYRSQWVTISGEVERPGRIILQGGTRLKDVMSEAGGFTSQGGEEISIMRRGPAGSPPVNLVVDRSDFERGKTNPVMAHGDVIEVARVRFCYVQGEVNRAGEIPLTRTTTLLKVISLAGGLTEWANRKDVRVLQYEDSGLPREQVYNLNQIEQGKVQDPILKGEEVVIVKKRYL